MPVVISGSVCARRGCRRPVWKDQLCSSCWRLCHLMSKDKRMFAYEPLHGYRDERDAVELPWDRWEQEARSSDRGVADLFGEGTD